MSKRIIEADDGQKDMLELALEGLRRVAFGPVNDAARLLEQGGELTAKQLKKLDLFAVSELKQKENSFEVKFYDRLRALELLAQLGKKPEAPSASSFYTALESAAKSACEADAV